MYYRFSTNTPFLRRSIWKDWTRVEVTSYHYFIQGCICNLKTDHCWLCQLSCYDEFFLGKYVRFHDFSLFAYPSIDTAVQKRYAPSYMFPNLQFLSVEWISASHAPMGKDIFSSELHIIIYITQDWPWFLEWSVLTVIHFACLPAHTYKTGCFQNVQRIKWAKMNWSLIYVRTGSFRSECIVKSPICREMIDSIACLRTA